MKKHAQWEYVTALENFIRKHPQNAAAYNELAILYANRGERSSALTCFQKAVAIASDNLEYQLNQVNILIAMQRYRNALSVLSGLLKKHSGDADVLTAIGEVSYKCGDKDNAHHFFKLAIEIQAEHSKAQKYLTLLADPEDANSVSSNSAPSDDTAPSKYVRPNNPTLFSA